MFIQSNMHLNESRWVDFQTECRTLIYMEMCHLNSHPYSNMLLNAENDFFALIYIKKYIYAVYWYCNLCLHILHYLSVSHISSIVYTCGKFYVGLSHKDHILWAYLHLISRTHSLHHTRMNLQTHTHTFDKLAMAHVDDSELCSFSLCLMCRLLQTHSLMFIPHKHIPLWAQT